MVSARASISNGPGSSLGVLFWVRHFTLTVPLSTQMYKWVPVSLMWGVALRWTSILSRGGEVEIPLVASCYRNWDKLWPDEPLGSYADFTLSINFCRCCCRSLSTCVSFVVSFLL